MVNEMRREPLSIWLSAARKVCWLTLLAVSCQDPAAGPSAGSNSNWLLACDVDSDCQSGACYCGSCTSECESDADCDALADARCVESAQSAYQTQCRAASASPGICLPRCEPGSCDDGQACVDGGCVLAALPEAELCAPVAAAASEQRKWEDELLALVNEARAAGGVSCGDEPPSAPADALRLDARLLCAARVFASDLEVTRSRSLVDSAGRNSQDRSAAAGYVSQSWAEALTFRASSPSDSLSIMLADQDSCHGLVAPSNRDVGVAHIGDVDVASLASE